MRLPRIPFTLAVLAPCAVASSALVAGVFIWQEASGADTTAPPSTTTASVPVGVPEPPATVIGVPGHLVHAGCLGSLGVTATTARRSWVRPVLLVGTGAMAATAVTAWTASRSSVRQASLSSARQAHPSSARGCSRTTRRGWQRRSGRDERPATDASRDRRCRGSSPRRRPAPTWSARSTRTTRCRRCGQSSPWPAGSAGR